MGRFVNSSGKNCYKCKQYGEEFPNHARTRGHVCANHIQDEQLQEQESVPSPFLPGGYHQGYQTPVSSGHFYTPHLPPPRVPAQFTPPQEFQGPWTDYQQEAQFRQEQARLQEQARKEHMESIMMIQQTTQQSLQQMQNMLSF